MEKGTIVLSTAGRDSGRLFAVVGIPEDNFRLIADGRLRKLDRPKKKKLRHLKEVGFSERLKELMVSEGLTNSLLHKELALHTEAKKASEVI